MAENKPVESKDMFDHLDYLRAGAQKGSIAHFFLFHGGDGEVRRAQALRWAAFLNCQALADPVLAVLPNPVPTQPCGVCSSCRKIGNGHHPDVVCLRPLKTSIGIDQIKALHRQAACKPYEGYYKVYILEEADKLTLSAANALLKLAEEPPAQTILILSAASDAAVLPTLRSRAQISYFPANAGETEGDAWREAWEMSGQNADLARALLELGLDEVRRWLAAYRQAVSQRDFLQVFALFPLERAKGILMLQALMAETIARLRQFGANATGTAEEAGHLSLIREALNAVRQQADIRLAIEVMALKQMT